MNNDNSSPASAIVEAFVNAIVEQVMLKMSTLDNDAIGSLAERVRRIEESYANGDDVVRIADRKIDDAINDLVEGTLDRRINEAIDTAIDDLRITR